MSKHQTKRRVASVALGLLTGLALAAAPACAGKGKGSRSPEECMQSCEAEKCAYDPNEVGNDAYLDCLEACEDKCG